jgi:hypothetical protein
VAAVAAVVAAAAVAGNAGARRDPPGVARVKDQRGGSPTGARPALFGTATSRLKIALIGAGRRSAAHLPVIAALDDLFELVGVADVELDAARA